MDVLGRTLTAGICLTLLAAVPCISAQAAQPSYSLLYDEDPNQSDSAAKFVKLSEDLGEYTVLPGDSLWKISEKLLGNGIQYLRLAAENREIIADPDLIYPGTSIHITKSGYFMRITSQRWLSLNKYCMDLPENFTVGYLASGNASANFALSGNGMCHIACLIRDKEASAVRTVKDWERCKQTIQRYADSQYGDLVSDLTFEHYKVNDEDDLYLYSYIYYLDLTAYDIDEPAAINVCAALRLTDHIQAEFIGFSNNEIHDAVRYTAASFQELCNLTDAESFTVNDSNMTLSPSDPWDAAGLTNPFSWVSEFLNGIFHKSADDAQAEVSPTQRLLDKLQKPRTGK